LVDGKAEYSALQKTRAKKFHRETVLLESDLEDDDSDIFLSISKNCTYHKPRDRKFIDEEVQVQDETVVTYLKPGTVFGKVPSFSSPLKTDTKIVRCVTDCKVVVLTASNFHHVCEEVTRRFLNLEVNFFRSIPLMKSMRKCSLSKIAT